MLQRARKIAPETTQSQLKWRTKDYDPRGCGVHRHHSSDGMPPISTENSGRRFGLGLITRRAIRAARFRAVRARVAISNNLCFFYLVELPDTRHQATMEMRKGFTPLVSHRLR